MPMFNKKEKRYKVRFTLMLSIILLFSVLIPNKSVFALDVLNPKKIFDMNLDNLNLDFLKDDSFTVMILGIDGEEYEGYRSDSIMVGKIDTKNKTLKIISIPRDTLVTIDGVDDKLGHAYSYGGALKTKEVLKENFNIDVDGYMCLNFNTFRKFIESLDGIDVEMSEEESEITRGIYEEGIFNIDGNEALTFARIRALDSDYMRTARQRRVVESIIYKLKEKERDTLPELLKIFNELVSTDISIDKIATLGLLLKEEDYKITSVLIPSEDFGYGEIVNGTWYLVADKEESSRLMKEFFKNQNGESFN